MKTFKMKADIRFSAEGIDDALTKLEKHFRNVRDFNKSDLIQAGSISIKPVMIKEEYEHRDTCIKEGI